MNKYFILFLSLSLFCACVEEEQTVLQNDHVLIVYMGGDNNLSDETYQKIDAIEKGWRASPSEKVVIYNDPSNGNPYLVEICGNKNRKILKTYPEQNSADAKVFARVIQDVQALYSSPSYGLLVFSHASGWLPEGALSKPKSIVVDGNNEMNMIDFANAIPDHSFQSIVFEACFMAGIEVVYELKDKTKYIVASSAEILSPGFTEVYPKTIQNLFLQKNGLCSFATDAFDYFDTQSGIKRSATFSIIETSELENLALFVKDNCDFSTPVDIRSVQHFDRSGYPLFFDFEDYYSRLIVDSDKRKEFSRLVSNCVIYKASTPFFFGNSGFAIQQHSGLTTYIPQARFPFLNTEYGKLKWARAGE